MRSARTLATFAGLWLVLSSGTALTAAAESAKSPTPWLKSVVERGRALASRKVQAGSPEEAKWKAEIKKIVDDALDWDEITRQALGKAGEERSPAERKEFGGLLREMIETSYQTKLAQVPRTDIESKPSEVKIDWLDEKVEGSGASAKATATADQKSVGLEFKLRWANNRWRIHDVLIDEVSTVRTYRSQFTKVIARDGFPALLKLMRKKIETIKSGKDISATAP